MSWESPITKVTNDLSMEIEKTIEGEVVKAVQKVVMSLCAVAAEADRREERMESVEKIPSASKTGEWNCDDE